MSGFTVSVVLITNYLSKHWLDTTPHNVNLLVKYLIMSEKKYPRNCSALTYWEEDYPSRLDLGKLLKQF